MISSGCQAPPVLLSRNFFHAETSWRTPGIVFWLLGEAPISMAFRVVGVMFIKVFSAQMFPFCRIYEIFSVHSHLAVHEHGEEPVAELGEVLRLGLGGEDLFVEGGSESFIVC